jgi:hypothetical protein
MNFDATAGLSYSNCGLIENPEAKNFSSSSLAFLGIDAKILIVVFFFLTVPSYPHFSSSLLSSLTLLYKLSSKGFFAISSLAGLRLSPKYSSSSSSKALSSLT